MARMGEKRRATRVRRRLKVVFDHDPHRKAQTTNLSATGIGVASDFVAIPGTVVSGTILLAQDQPAQFQAKIRWARKARGRSALDNTNTMGLEFVRSPGAAYEAFSSRHSTRTVRALGNRRHPTRSPFPNPAPARTPALQLRHPTPVSTPTPTAASRRPLRRARRGAPIRSPGPSG